MGNPVELKVRLVLRGVGGPDARRQDIDLRALSPLALRFLVRMEPQLQEKSFYERPIGERVVGLQPRTMLAAVGHPDRPVQPHPDHLLLPEIAATSRRFQLSHYGHPRDTETYVKWLEGSARAVENARSARQGKLDVVNAMLDQRLDGWLRSLAAKEPAETVVPHDDLVWRLDWRKVRFSPVHAQDLAFKQRLRARVLATNGGTMRSFMASIPELEKFVEAADRYARPAPAFTFAGASDYGA